MEESLAETPILSNECGVVVQHSGAAAVEVDYVWHRYTTMTSRMSILVRNRDLYQMTTQQLAGSSWSASEIRYGCKSFKLLSCVFSRWQPIHELYSY
jgi:hypothetical protein